MSSRAEAAARREAETRAAISAHAAKIVEEYGPLTAEQVAALRPVFADMPRTGAPEHRGAVRGRAS